MLDPGGSHFHQSRQGTKIVHVRVPSITTTYSVLSVKVLLFSGLINHKMTTSEFKCKSLVLDAGPLLSLSPLRGLAETFFTVPQVLDELKDKRAREHFEKLGLMSGVKIEIRSADAVSLLHGMDRWLDLINMEI